MRLWSKLSVLTATLLSVACGVTPPKDVKIVDNFQLPRYLGTWYEIARLDHSFERGLDHVTANYSLRDDGGVKVVNRGYNVKKQQWQESVGKAYFIGSPQQASLKVSFFGPFYGGYNVIDLDDEYQHALIAGPNRDYLWILSRTPTIDTQTQQRLAAVAQHYGFPVDKLIWVEQGEMSLRQ